MDTDTHRPTWKTLLAFEIIYFVSVSTFFAIRVGVREVPAFLLAATLFPVAGLVHYGWMIARGLVTDQASGKSFTATSLSRRASRARYTSPMPPAPAR
jgi:hypothetical protein